MQSGQVLGLGSSATGVLLTLLFSRNRNFSSYRIAKIAPVMIGIVAACAIQVSKNDAEKYHNSIHDSISYVSSYLGALSSRGIQTPNAFLKLSPVIVISSTLGMITSKLFIEAFGQGRLSHASAALINTWITSKIARYIVDHFRNPYTHIR